MLPLLLLLTTLLAFATSTTTTPDHPTTPQPSSRWKGLATLFFSCLSPLFITMGQKHSTSISYPLPFDTEMDAAQIFHALEYVSRDLRRKRLHVHLIVGGSSLPCLVHKTKPTWYILLSFI
jgi:hypothetical protein